MPILTLENSDGGPICDLLVGVSAQRYQALRNENLPVPPPVRGRGLVDTGASNTCVDPQILQALQISPKAVVPMITPSTGSIHVDAPVYDVSLTIVLPRMSYTFKAQSVIESSLNHQGFSILIGRDILSHGMLIYQGVGDGFQLIF